jgi:predicted HAD superfamily phosphohydrolase YqeG
VDAYFVGKPNPLIMRLALSRLGTHRHETVIIGDRCIRTTRTIHTTHARRTRLTAYCFTLT